MYIGLFLACGNDSDAVNHSWYDTLTNKDFWREVMEKQKMRVPLQLGRWDGSTLKMDHELKCDVVLKITDSYLGIGDKFLDIGTDFSSLEDLTRILETSTFLGASGVDDSYAGKEGAFFTMDSDGPLV